MFRKMAIPACNQGSEGEGDDVSGENYSSIPIKARRSSGHNTSTENCCFFCDLEDDPSNLHAASTFLLDQRVRKCAATLQDRKLFTTLSAGGDMIAIEAQYHAKCLASLYNKARQLSKDADVKSACTEEPINEDELAFAELVAYIDEFMETEDPSVLKLSDMVQLFSSKFKSSHERINSTRLKERIMAAFPDLTAHSIGRDVVLAPRDDIGDVLMVAKQNKDSMICCLAKAARIIRKEILQVKNTFNGTFAPECQQHAVPASLKTFLHLILKGSNSRINPDDNKACLTIAQLMVFNSVSRAREKPESAGSTLHIRARECPLPIYTAIKIHGVTRNRALIDAFYHLGLSISYDRLLSISTEIANNVVGRYESEGVVCPFKLFLPPLQLTISIIIQVPPLARTRFTALQYLWHSIQLKRTLDG